MVRVLPADDEAMVRAGVRALLDSGGEVEVVAETGDGREAVEPARVHRPDVAPPDVRMPRLDGLAAAEEIVRTVPGTPVAVLTTFSEHAYVARALAGGATGFLLKSGGRYELLARVRAVAGGGAFLSPRVARYVIEGLGGTDGGGRLVREVEVLARVEALSPRGGTQPTRARGARPGRGRAVQPGDRRPAVSRRGHGEGARECGPGPARRAQSRTGGDRRGRGGVGGQVTCGQDRRRWEAWGRAMGRGPGPVIHRATGVVEPRTASASRVASPVARTTTVSATAAPSSRPAATSCG